MGEQLNKIALIGPVYPYKGGIAHYTGAMYRALSKKYQVDVVSFSLQYPSILYRKEQKDFTNDSFKIPSAKYLINTVNPLSWVTAAMKIEKGNYQLVIVQWWHPYFSICYWGIGKLLRTPVIFVCHNVLPHERFFLDKWLTKNVLKEGNGFIVHSQKDRDDLEKLVVSERIITAVHPTYNMFQFEHIDKWEGRKRIGASEEEKILLFFGFVREYKGLKHLIRALPLVTKDISDIRLLIVGDFAEDKEQYMDLIRENGIEDKIDIFDGYIPDREVEKFFIASDLVVLPYESATQSGIVQIAYGFNKPVIVTDVGGLPDVVADDKTGYVVEHNNPDQLAQAIIKFFRENKAIEFEENIRKESERFSWDRMVEHIEQFNENITL